MIKLSKCSLDERETIQVKKALEANYLGHGSFVRDFEDKISTFLGGDVSVVCVNSGTAALHLALESLDLPHGSEVLVPSITYVATYQAISAAGLVPISCEVNPKTMFIDSEDARRRITSNTRCIVPVHHSGASEGITEVVQLAREFDLRIVEDAAQAFGSNNCYGKVGSNPIDIICFSFDGIKNITCGEGGAIVSKDQVVIQKCQDSRFLGVEKDTQARNAGLRSWTFDVQRQGYRYHMSNINAAIGLVQIEKVSAFRDKRQNLVKYYKELLRDIEEISFLDINYNVIIPHIFLIKCEKRDELKQFLESKKIETGIHYYPNHLLTKFKVDYNLVHSIELHRCILTLPLHVELSFAEIEYVCNKINEFYNVISD